MKRFLHTIFISLILAAALANAQPLSVTSTVNQTSVAVNQQLALTVELSGQGAQKVGQPDLPDMGGYLSFLSSGGTSQNISFVNGKMSVSKSFTFYYLAAKEGNFTIPAIQVTYDGKTYSSQPIDITITQGSAQPQQPTQQAAPSTNSENGASKEDLFVRTFVNKKRVHQGEPILVTYRIYSAVNVSGYSISKLPETTGFWVEDLESPQQPQVKKEVLNGKQYVTADIKKLAVYPTSSGNKTIGSMVVQCEVRVQERRSRRDVFDSFFDDAFFGRTVRQSVAAPAVEVTVLPFPEENKPDSFNGAVGQYDLKATVDKTDVNTDEAVTLTVTISGTGNIRLLPKPEVTIPADFEQYDPEETESINRTSTGVSGKKTFEYVLVPRFPGVQKIRPIRYSYFDPQKEEYVTLTSPEMVINVSGGKGQLVASGGSGLSKEEVRYVGQDIRFIKLESDGFRRIGSRFYTSFPFFVLLLFPALVFGLAVGYKSHQAKLSENVAYARSRKANSIAMRRLSKAKSLLSENSQKEFFAEVSDALSGFAADKLNMAKAGLLSDELEREFQRRHIESGLTKEYFDLIRLCDFQRFAPATVSLDTMEDAYQKAKNVIIKLEKTL